jgi:hypothetical protein
MGDGEVERAQGPIAAPHHGAGQGHHPRPVALGRGEHQPQSRIRPRRVGHLDALGAAAHLACPRRHPLSAHRHPLAEVLVIVVGVGSGAPEAGRGAPAHLLLGGRQLGPPLERTVVLGERPLTFSVALALVGVPAPTPVARLAGAAVKSNDLVRRLGQERPVVGDEHEPAGAGGEQPGETLQPIGVQVVGGLVEQDHIAARHRQGGEPGARGLSPGQRPQWPVQAAGLEAELVERRAQSRLDIGAAEREPAVQRGGVRLDRGEVSGRQRRGPAFDVAVGAGHPDAVADRLANGQLRSGRVGHLRQIADAGEPSHHPAVRRFAPRHDPQQRRFARAVGADEPDPASGVDAEVDAVQHGPVAVSPTDPSSIQQGRGHARTPSETSVHQDSIREPPVHGPEGQSRRMSARRHAYGDPKGSVGTVAPSA